MGSPESTGVPSQDIPTVGPEQTQVLNIIMRGNDDGSHVDKFQILKRVNYTDKIQSVWFIIRYMLVQKRIAKAGRQRRMAAKIVSNAQTYKITNFGKSLITVDVDRSTTSDYKQPML